MEGKLREAGYDIVPFGESADLGISIHVRSRMRQMQVRNTIRRFNKRSRFFDSCVIILKFQLTVAMVQESIM